MNITTILKGKLTEAGGIVNIPQQKSANPIKAPLHPNGIEVDKLGANGLLIWEVFTETIALLKSQGGKTARGNVRKDGARLGDEDIPLNSVEGHIASKVYDVQEGESVFMRISSIANILVWAEVCEHERGFLLLKKNANE